MRDIVPPEAELRRQVANRILDIYAGYGYEVIETPAFEDLDVLMGSDGGDNEKLIFKVLKRGPGSRRPVPGKTRTSVNWPMRACAST